jgi:hypothetical protein
MFAHVFLNADSSNDQTSMWSELSENPGNFWDNRAKKFNPKSPDFKHKQSGKGLWLESMPTWVQLPELRTFDAQGQN